MGHVLRISLRPSALARDLQKHQSTIRRSLGWLSRMPRAGSNSNGSHGATEITETSQSGQRFLCRSRPFPPNPTLCVAIPTGTIFFFLAG